MAITTTGYSLKRYEDIIAEVRQAIITASGNPNIDLSDDSLLGTLNNVWATKYAELYELAQAHWSAMDVDTATGDSLDRLVRRANITRLQAVKASGELTFTGSVGAIISSGTQVRDLASNVVQTLTQISLDTTGVVGAVFNITLQNNATYSVVVNGVTYSFTSDSNATVNEIVLGLRTAMSALTTMTVSDVSGRLSLVSTVPFNFTTSNNLTTFTVSKSVLSEALVASTEDFEAGVLVFPVSSIGSTTVTNRQKWITGRLREEDNELRNRFYASRGGKGNATVEALFSKLVALSNVQSAYVEENYTEVTNANGLPSKSFEATVKGGSDIEVANTIWQTKPAGIRPFGNTSFIVTDSQNIPQTIFFSRPIDAYIHVRVVYQIYSEEIFPSNGQQMIANAVKAYGDSLGLNEDVNPQRIMAAIYQSVAGIGSLQVSVGRTSSPSDTPVYQSTSIPIARKEEAVFDLSRISVST